jgi:carbamoyl-phosphate synthase large subunit
VREGGLRLPRRPDLHKVLVIGSGPIVIGQAAEFDYAGTQACQALREEGLQVVLVNSNPATIMTDAEMADRVYLEPLTVDHLEAVIARERPQGLLAGLGGQVGLNLAVALHEAGVLQRYGVELLGTPLEAIRRAEDRELFRETMRQIGEPVPESCIVRSLEEARAFATQIGLPLIVRPAYTLGGTGGGFANSLEELEEVVLRGLRLSPIGQCLLERSIYGWKEIEYEVMRDGRGNCITVCNMENVDPVGVHTGDSIVVAPSQTLSDRDYQRLRHAALHIIDRLGIAGGCNVQFAADPNSDAYHVIEVNPRVSRSSALASKATGYPIAKVAAKIAVGLTLDEIRNPVTGTTSALFEPSLDYVVLKIPRWPFDKFRTAERELATQMKATGEVMAIDRTFEGALQKALRALDVGLDGLELREAREMPTEALLHALRPGDDRRLLLLAEAFRRGVELEELHRRTAIDPWFLRRIQRIVHAEREVASRGAAVLEDPALLRRLKELGFSDARLGSLVGVGAGQVRAARLRHGVTPVYKMVDTCAAEFEAATPYFYSCYDREDEARPSSRPKVLVLGSGPIRIGQGIEFDYSSVHAVWALREAGYEAIIVNNNPETVSTDWSTADRLYFEPLTLEDVLNVIDKERPSGVIAQFGGQTAINLAAPLAAAGVPLLGTSAAGIDAAEDRGQFDALLERLGIPRPAGGSAKSLAEARAVAERVGYPVLVRPSYVLGGRAMEICYTPEDLAEYVESAVLVSPEHPILVDRYVGGREVEVDAVSDGRAVLIAGILEHVERAGVHSGDSIAIYPPRSLSPEAVAAIERYTLELARALGVRGMMNVQYVVDPEAAGAAGGGVFVLEVNPRASRTVPFLTKVTGVPLVRVATRVLLGQDLEAQGYPGPVYRPREPRYVAVKMPVFSWSKLRGVDTALGPEMKSTGEVMGIGATYAEALAKGFRSCGIGLPEPGATALVMIADRDKPAALPLLRRLHDLGLRLLATAGTRRMLLEHGIPAELVHKLKEGSPDCLDVLRRGGVHLVVNTLTRGRRAERDGFRVRRTAAELGVPCLTSLDTLAALLDAVEAERERGQRLPEAWCLQEYAARA